MAPQGYGSAAERLRRATVQVQVPGRFRGSGSGVIWTPEGLLVTNAHVARGDRAFVELWDGRRLEARVTARDLRRDLAALRVEAVNLPAATPGDSAVLRPGELVLAVGNPLGFIGALTTGIVHAVGPVPPLGPRTWVQADVRLAPGNSGGPLANAAGHVIGINTMVAAGLALAVPVNAVGRFLRQGSSGASLGVTVRPVPLVVNARRTLGLLVLEVAPGSPAAAASLFVGDILTGAGGMPFHSLEDLSRALEAGGPVRLEFLRGGRSVPREAIVRIGVPEEEAA